VKIYTGSDHAGVTLRIKLVSYLRAQGHEIIDFGPADQTPSDYPDDAARLGSAVRDDQGSLGLLVCGSGLGICVAANKVRGVRAVSPWNVETARLSRQHNDANVLCLGERLTTETEAKAILDTWLSSTFEGGRHARRVAKIAGIEAVEAAAAAVDAERHLLGERHVPRRIWTRDWTVFTADQAHQKSILNRLGWLDAPAAMETKVPEMVAFANEIKSAGFTHAVLLGMGGSSLCPEVLAETFGSAPGALKLHVLDNTDPASVSAVDQAIDFDKTLFLVASKSGGTIEVRSFERYFWQKALDRHGGNAERAGQQFVAITDPGTKLEARAKESRYRRAFVNAADIGGRYSALSYFGLVPAALLGMDVARFVRRGREMADACRNEEIAKNPGADLGALLGAMAKQGRDKMTLVLAPEIAHLGSWIEQLVAESTGKLGKGVVPIDGETLGAPESYGPDRVFVVVNLKGGKPAATAEQLQALRGAGHPTRIIELEDRYDLGAEFFRWEFATAVAGASLEVNPFDEPNVTEAKDVTGRLLEAFNKDKRLPAAGKTQAPDDAALVTHAKSAQEGDYLAICAFFHRTEERERLLQEIRTLLRDRLHLATTVGYGPRFLHSTGQLHKGGANNGVFLQLAATVAQDLPVPGEPFSFGVLRDAQGLGDYEVLQKHGRRSARVELGTDVEGGLRRLRDRLATL
jgi:transaldolase / glucose-6-phosphate isomerase